MQNMSDQIDFVLHTDGSGHVDGVGGYAALVTSSNGISKSFCLGAMSCTSVDRCEFMALIEGLRIVMEMWRSFDSSWEWHSPVDRQLLKPNVQWFSDRESLVKSVLLEYGRSNCEDLWAAFEWYEQRMCIEANHITEPVTEEKPEFVECDLSASTMRVMLKAYLQNTPLVCDPPLPKPKKSKKTTETESKQS